MDLVGARVVCEAKGDDKLDLCGKVLLFFGGATDGLDCADGLRRSRCDRSGGPTSRNGIFSPLKLPTPPHKFVRPSSVTWNMPWSAGQTPKLNVEIDAKTRQNTFYVKFGVFKFFLKMPAWLITF